MEKQIEFELTTDQRKVTAIVSKDGIRPGLECVHIKKGKIETANGFVLIQKDITYDYDQELLLSADEINQHKNTPNHQTVKYIYNGNGEIRAIGKYRHILDNRNLTYIDLDQIYPKGEPVNTFTVDKNFLKQIIQAMDMQDNAITFELYPPDKINSQPSPIKFSNQEKTTTGLIMPIWDGLR